MRVHLIRSKEFSPQTYQAVLQILHQFQGPIAYLASETELTLSNAVEVEIASKEDFEKADEKRMHSDPAKIANMSMDRRRLLSELPAIEFPHKTLQTSWDDFFKICDQFRSDNHLAKEDLVILLTDVGNDANWFGGADKTMKNAFIHTAEWHHYFDGLNERFPIAYEVLVWTMRMLIISDASQMSQYWHQVPKGCMSDLCQDKKQIVLKMRTADICENCMELLKGSGADVRVLGQIIDGMEGVRRYFISTERAQFLHRPSIIQIKGFTHRIFLKDYGNIELNLNPKQRAIYCFFLRHPEGVRLVDLIDYRNEIGALYHRFSNFGSLDEINAALDILLDPTNNNLNEVLSRIRSMISRTLGQRISENYLIQGKRGEPYKINLNSELIDYQSEI